MLELPPWPRYEEDEVQAAAAVLRSGRVNQWTGPDVAQFEVTAAEAFGVRHALALSNGTVALELMLSAVGIGPGDDVVVPARTFIATAAAVFLRGARPVVADVDPDSGGLTAATARAALTPATKAILPVHLGGWPCPMRALRDLAKERGLLLLEDCAQAHGARVDGRTVGAWGHAAAFSFCQDKIISTGGEGGMVATDDDRVAEAVWSLRDHGKDRREATRTDHPPGFRWIHRDFGTNARLTGPQAAIGRVQMGKLPGWLAERRRNAARLRGRLRGLPGLRVPQPGPDVEEAPYRVYAYLEPEAWARGWNHGRVLGALAERGVPGGVGSCGEIHREAAFGSRGLGPAQPLPVAARLAAGSLAFPVHPGLADHHVDAMADAVADVLASAVR